MTWRCLNISQQVISGLLKRVCRTDLFISVATSLSSMVFRPACFEYAAKSWLTCSKYHADACSIASSAGLLILVFEPAFVPAKRVASFLTIPLGRVGTGIPWRDICFCLPRVEGSSSRKPPPTIPECSLGEAAGWKFRPKSKPSSTLSLTLSLPGGGGEMGAG